MDPLIGALLALAAASIWGGADFCGGLASRRSNPYQVVVLSASSGLLLLIIAALLRQEAFPDITGIAWSIMAGITGGLGIVALYRALAIAPAALVAPTAGVIGAILPVLVSLLTEGLPPNTGLAGFGLAFIGIYSVAGKSLASSPASQRGLLLAFLAGIGFGGFFTSLSQVSGELIFTPLILTRSVTLLIGLLLVRKVRLPLPAPLSNPTALLAGLLDAGGNLLYVLALQFTRLDISAVLGSLYPASTVLLAALLLKERITLRQGLGVLACLGAVVLITL